MWISSRSVDRRAEGSVPPYPLGPKTSSGAGDGTEAIALLIRWKRASEGLVYSWYEREDHLPPILIVESCSRAIASEVAPPMR